MFDQIHRLIERLHGYSWWQVAVELLLIWLVVYFVVRFVQGTRAAGALKSTLLLVIVTTFIVRLMATPEQFQRIKYLYDTFITLLAITLIVVFQPELRRGLIRLGETPIRRRSTTGPSEVIDAIVEAAAYLSKARFGGLIVLERESGLKGLVEGGTPLHARVSARLLQTIFFPGSALHDLAVIIKGGEVIAAGVQLPLAEPADMPDPTLGSRHRAAVGLTKECNALVVVVSEETGAISIAERGRLDRGLSPDQLREELWQRTRRSSAPAPAATEEHPATEMLLSDSGEHATLGPGDSMAGMSNGDTAAPLTEPVETSTREVVSGSRRSRGRGSGGRG